MFYWQSIRRIALAWEKVKHETLMKCFRKSQRNHSSEAALVYTNYLKVLRYKHLHIVAIVTVISFQMEHLGCPVQVVTPYVQHSQDWNTANQRLFPNCWMLGSSYRDLSLTPTYQVDKV